MPFQWYVSKHCLTMMCLELYLFKLAAVSLARVQGDGGVLGRCSNSDHEM